MSDFEKERPASPSDGAVQETRVIPSVDGESFELPTTRTRRSARSAVENHAAPQETVQTPEVPSEQADQPVQETTVQPAQPMQKSPAEAAGETTIQPAVKQPAAEGARFGSRVTTREPLRREAPAQGVPRPEALRRADQPGYNASGTAGERPLYRPPVSAPGYSASKPVGTAPRRPAIPESDYKNEKPTGGKGKGLIIAVAVVLVLALAVLGILLIPDDMGGVLGSVKHSVTGLLGGSNGEEGSKVTEQPPIALEFYAALTQVNTGETVTFNLTTNKNATDVRLVDANGVVLTTQNTQVDNTDSLIWIIKMVPAVPYFGPVYAQVANGDNWIDTNMMIELEVLAGATATMEPVVELATQAPVVTDVPAAPSEEPVVPGDTVTEAVADEPQGTDETSDIPDELTGEEIVDETLIDEPEYEPDPFFDAEVTPTLAPSATPASPMMAATPVPETAETQAPVPATPEPAAQTAGAEVQPEEKQLEVAAAESADPSLISTAAVYDGSKAMTSYLRDQADIINMPAGAAYTRLPYGVLTFRGNAFRQNAAEGTVDDLSEMAVLWKKSASSAKGSGSTTYYGINYTGQPAIIKWSTEVRGISNLSDDAKNTKGLTEVIVAGDDGRIYFLSLKDGEATRKEINVGYPLRGTPSIHPYGFPLMSVGQYARKMSGKTGDIGLRFYSLVDQKQVYMIDGLDKSFSRPYYGVGSFETSALYDPEADTMVTAATNGMLYLTKLNTRFEYNATTGEGSMNISPSTVVMRSKAAKQDDKLTAVESSVAMYQNYVFYADMKGILRCVDTTTLETKWAVDTGDAVEAAISLELDEHGTLWLYTANTLQNRKKGSCQVRRYDASTGALDWQLDVPVSKPSKNKNIAGFRASAVIGQEQLSDYVYYTASYVTKAGGQELGFSGSVNGALLCIEKNTGKVVWSRDLGAYSYSSPVAVYSEAGKGWIIQASSNGTLFLLDGQSGETVNTLKLEGTINASPAVYKNTLVIGTTGKGKSAIYGIELK